MFAVKKQHLHPSATDTLIGEGSQFEGKVRSEASIRIEGQVTGDVYCAGDVTIGEHGTVKSHVAARNLVLAGTVYGDVFVGEKLTITATGRLFGNTKARSFVIEEGGIFHGISQMAEGGSNREEPAGDGQEDGAGPLQQAYPGTAAV